MNVKVLIDAIVRQTTVLIAQLATAAGIRAPLAHIANQVFLELVTELESQGVGRKVIADMFGLALRSYQLKVRRLSGSVTEQNHSLWEAVYDHLQQSRGPKTRAEILMRFVRDDESVVRSVLNDLVESGLVIKKGRAGATTYKAIPPEKLSEDDGHSQEAIEAMVQVYIYRNSPILRQTLADELRLSGQELDAALKSLLEQGRAQTATVDGEEVLSSTTFILPLEAPFGWEAALFDHYQAVVNAFSNKLTKGHTRSLPRDVIGGSTYSFDVWEGHPHKDEVYALLRTMRDQLSELRTRVTDHNEDNRSPDRPFEKVTFYMGQNVRFENEKERKP